MSCMCSPQRHAPLSDPLHNCIPYFHASRALFYEGIVLMCGLNCPLTCTITYTHKPIACKLFGTRIVFLFCICTELITVGPWSLTDFPTNFLALPCPISQGWRCRSIEHVWLMQLLQTGWPGLMFLGWNWSFPPPRWIAFHSWQGFLCATGIQIIKNTHVPHSKLLGNHFPFSQAFLLNYISLFKYFAVGCRLFSKNNKKGEWV